MIISMEMTVRASFPKITELDMESVCTVRDSFIRSLPSNFTADIYSVDGVTAEVPEAVVEDKPEYFYKDKLYGSNIFLAVIRRIFRKPTGSIN